MVDPVSASIIGGASALANLGVGYYNIQQQQKNLAYQKWVQKRAWAREDTAVRRRSRDLELAGLSKTLAAGSAAQSSSPIMTHAPQADARSFDPVARYMDVTRTLAETQLVKANAEYQEQKNKEGLPALESTKIEEETKLLLQQLKTSRAIEAKTWSEKQTNDYNRMYAQIAEISQNASGMSQAFGTGIYTLKTTAALITEELKNGQIKLDEAAKKWEAAVQQAKQQAIKEGLKPNLPIGGR